MSREAEEKMVCVTGGSGYIASVLIKHLLQRGYTVNATLRDPSDPKKTERLLALDGAKERLRLFKANLLEEGAFDSAIQGCDGVFHAAAHVAFTVDDPQTQLIDPAVKGTLNVLKSCVKAGSVKRVIITSSLATVIYNGKHMTPNLVIDETWYSDPEICKELKHWYAVAKTLADKVAWSFTKENDIDLVTIHPGFVIGPLVQPIISSSVKMFLDLVNGAETYPNGYYRTIDVRDVADVHILAFEIPSANGRYCLNANVTHFSDILKIVQEKYPTLKLPNKCVESKMLISTLPKHEISTEKVKSLGISLIPLEATLRDTIESLKENGFLSI